MDDAVTVEACIEAMQARLIEGRRFDQADAHKLAIEILDEWEGEVELTDEWARALVDEAIERWGRRSRGIIS
jgi:hypothetical protein